mmetsp:Transcript_27769/g.81221  ORF Transcript_27769/g.81221 Transcript_27769/m.81221 type:complete len:364 (-) Transcript_27769:2766-3857(-)
MEWDWSAAPPRIGCWSPPTAMERRRKSRESGRPSMLRNRRLPMGGPFRASSSSTDVASGAEPQASAAVVAGVGGCGDWLLLQDAASLPRLSSSSSRAEMITSAANACTEALPRASARMSSIIMARDWRSRSSADSTTVAPRFVGVAGGIPTAAGGSAVAAEGPRLKLDGGELPPEAGMDKAPCRVGDNDASAACMEREAREALRRSLSSDTFVLLRRPWAAALPGAGLWWGLLSPEPDGPVLASLMDGTRRGGDRRGPVGGDAVDDDDDNGGGEGDFEGRPATPAGGWTFARDEDLGSSPTKCCRWSPGDGPGATSMELRCRSPRATAPLKRMYLSLAKASLRIRSSRTLFARRLDPHRSRDS